MIRARELRIGNWVDRPFYNPHPIDPGMAYSHAVVEQIKISAAYVRLDKSTVVKCPFEDLMPIELTPDILEKAGFESGSLTKDIDEIFFLTFFKDGCKLQIEKDDNYGHYICESLSLGHIKYVHQLQNLWHALTDTELTIKL